jgi:sodium/pantothenate symporter
LEQSSSLIWMIGSLLVIYFLFTTWLGKKGVVHSRSMGGFSIAKGKVNPWIVGISFGASFASANLFIGVPGWAYTYGTSTLWWTLGCFGITWIGLLLFAKKFWRYGQERGGVFTLPQWLGNRYNSKALQVIVAFLILFNIYYIVGQNVGLATMFETVVGIPYIWGIVIGVGITIIYVSLGGAYAQLISDGVQGIIMAVTSVLIFISLVWTIGGGWNFLGNLHQQLGQIDSSLVSPFSNGGPFHSGFAILTIQWLLFTFVLLPHLMNKVLTLEDEKQLRPFTLSAGITLFFLSTLAVFAGMAARVLHPGLAVADQAVAVYILEAFPPIVVAIMIAGLISAILSTTDSLYLGMTSSVGNDLYKVLVAPFIYKNKQTSQELIDQNALKISKVALVFIGVVSLYMSINRPASLALLTQFGISAIISGIIAPITLGYFWKRATRSGAIASVISGSGIYMILTSTGIVPQVFEALFYSSIIGFIVMYAISLVTVSVLKEEKVWQAG